MPLLRGVDTVRLYIIVKPGNSHRMEEKLVIQSSMQSAQDVATKMGQAGDAVQQVASMNVTKSGKTTLTVNEQAQKANDELVTIAELISTCFEEAIDNIHSVAKEFERTDVELDSSINELLEHTDGLDKSRAYERAKNG